MAETATVLIAFRDADIDAWVTSSRAPPELVEAAELLVTRKLQPRALHRGSRDVALARWYAVDVPVGQVREVLEVLLAHPAVTSAFVKPQDALP